jgi:hypothetical protein
LNMLHISVKFVPRLFTDDQSLRPTTEWLSFPILYTLWAMYQWFCFVSQINWNWRNDVLKQCLTSKGNRERYSTSLRKLTSILLNYWVMHPVARVSIKYWKNLRFKKKKYMMHYDGNNFY